MTATTLLALADRCEQAAGPDRKLDNAILSALGYSWRGMAYWHNDDNHVLKGSTFFTKILDAAVTLYPTLPEVIPSCPRKASAAALRARAAMLHPAG